MREEIIMARKKIELNSKWLLSEVYSLFENKCRIKNLTENSIKSYKDKFGEFVNFIGDVPVEEVKEKDIDSFILYLRERGIKDVSINSILRAVRAVMNYSYDLGYSKKLQIKLIKQEKEIKETYTEKELKILLKKPKTNSFNEYKIWVLENYLLGTGNRISTCLDIKIGDIDFRQATIILRKTKNRKQQIIPLPSSLLAILREYLKIRQGNDDDYLFCNSYGEKANQRVIQQMVADYNKKRGVMKTSCHLFRHTFAKMYILNGGDSFRLQQLLGHSSMYITKEYVNMFSNELSIGYDNFNPLNSIVANCEKRKL